MVPASSNSGVQIHDRLIRGLIITSGMVCFVLLAWSHLGLGARIIPPSASPLHQSVSDGSYHIDLTLASGQLTAQGPNTITFVVRDGSGQALSPSTIRVQLAMTTMAMYAPDCLAQRQLDGTYAAHPLFGMAGSWRMMLIIPDAGHASTNVSFDVNVHWS